MISPTAAVAHKHHYFYCTHSVLLNMAYLFKGGCKAFCLSQDTVASHEEQANGSINNILSCPGSVRTLDGLACLELLLKITLCYKFFCQSEQILDSSFQPHVAHHSV
jgi:hypothetical protein